MITTVMAITLATVAQADNATGHDTPSPWQSMDARHSVQWGNETLRAGDADSALKAYEHARGLAPDEFRIPFVEGLGYFAKHDYQAAREAFERAALTDDPRLANDATYSLGTCDHAEALAGGDDPKQTMQQLEDAIQRYQDVLANQPDHAAARDAIRKAAAMRRQIKQQMQQQEQQSQDDGEKSDKDDQENQDKQNQDEKSSDEQEDQDEQSEQERTDSEDQQDQKQNGDEQQQEETSESDKQEEQQQQEASEQQEKDFSKEQAERQLREMMQAMRERQERRRQPAKRFQVVPVDKDW